jgi:DNA-binding PadR family transcriptional regulator
MSLPRTLLGLLDPQPAHGYDLKRSYDQHFGAEKPLAYGQVYAALARMLGNGLIEVAGVEPGEGPERKRYAITDAGVTELRTWLGTPEPPAAYLQSTLYTKVVLALLTGADPRDLLETQRAAHLAEMRTLTRRKQGGDFPTQLICDHALLHLEADLRWLELTAARIESLKATVAR